MGDFYRDNPELQYYVERGIDWAPLVELTEHDFQFEDGFDTTDEAVDFYRSVLEMVGEFVAEEIAPRADELLGAWDPDRDFAHALLHAERLTRLLADEAICDLLYEQSQTHPERREVLERYLERARPRCRHLEDVIASRGERLLDELDERRSERPEAAE